MTAETQRELSVTSADSTIARPRQDQPPHPLADLRHAAMSVPIEQIQGLLADYMARRTEFRQWLLRQLEIGVHFGVPPGCEPKGNVNPDQWKHKPSLYKAGAEFICDLMNVRAMYSADVDGLAQLGKTDKQFFVYKCELVSRQNGEILGEGTGARQLGTKGGDVNNTVKMAQKNALVAAVLNVYGLSDLFTQDLENVQHDNPPANPNAPTAAPRGQRFTRERLNGFYGRFREFINPHGLAHDFTIWLKDTTGHHSVDFTKVENWTPAMVNLIEEALRKVEPPE